MSELPKGWASARLNDVCELINGRAYKQTELLESGRYPVLRVGNFFSNRSWYYSDLELEADKYCDRGDLLYAWSASFGPRIWEGEKSIFHYHIWKTRLIDLAVEKRFLYHWFEWDKENIQAEHGTGSTMIHVTKGDMEARALELPPLPEQRRIVAKIDSLTGKSRRARDHLDHIPRLAEKYKQAVLAAAFRGDLTREWRAASGVADTWNVVYLSRLIIEGPTNGWSPKSGADAAGALTLKLTATTSGVLRLDDAAVKHIYETPPSSSKFWLEPGDVLVQRSNTIDYVGATAIFDGPSKTYIYPDLMMRIRVSDDTMRRYVWRFLNADAARTYIRQNATGTAGNMPKISGATLKALPVRLPQSGEERTEIVRKIETAFAWIDRLASEATSARNLIDRLDQSVLAKAFRGELVPQDPADEPASVLLERIRAQRYTAPRAKLGRKAGTMRPRGAEARP